MAALDSLSLYPQLIDDIFLTKFLNPVQAVAVKFYIRGKPWVVSIDDTLLFQTKNNKLVFGQGVLDDKVFWAALLEKAWAKVEGNYLNA